MPSVSGLSGGTSSDNPTAQETVAPPGTSPPAPGPTPVPSPPGYYPPPPGPYPPPPYYYPQGYPPSIYGYPQSFAPAATAPAGHETPAQSLPPPQGAYTHDGFFLRLQFGGNFVSLLGSDSSHSLFGPAFDLAIGGALARRLVLYGELLEHVGFSEEDTLLLGLGVAAGMSYFFANNMFVGGSLGFGGASYQTSKAKDSPPMKNAFLAKAEVGHEWWVSYNWGLGASIQFVVTSATDNRTSSDDPPTLDMLVCRIMFSATYN